MLFPFTVLVYLELIENKNLISAQNSLKRTQFVLYAAYIY